MRIEKDVEFCDVGSGKCAILKAILDTGALDSYISKDGLKKLDGTMKAYSPPKSISTVTKGATVSLIGVADMEFTIEKCKTPTARAFQVMPEMMWDAIIGALDLEYMGARIEMGRTPEETRVVFKQCPPNVAIAALDGDW